MSSIFQRPGDSAESPLFPVDADISDEGLKRTKISNIQLPGDAKATAVFHRPLPQRSNHAETQQQMLNLTGHPLAHRRVAQLRLPAPEDARPAVCGEQSIEEQREQSTPKFEHG